MLSAPGVIFIEGVGGIMVPLDQTHTVLDWMSALRVPVLVVAGSYLGTISHTLTALHVLAQRNLDIAGVVVSESAVPGASLDADGRGDCPVRGVDRRDRPAAAAIRRPGLVRSFEPDRALAIKRPVRDRPRGRLSNC